MILPRNLVLIAGVLFASAPMACASVDPDGRQSQDSAEGDVDRTEDRLASTKGP